MWGVVGHLMLLVIESPIVVCRLVIGGDGFFFFLYDFAFWLFGFFCLREVLVLGLVVIIFLF